MSGAYATLMSTTEWHDFKANVFSDKADIQCEQCQTTESLQVHHDFYKEGYLPWEYHTDDVRLLCPNCHQQTHAFINNAIECVCSLPIGKDDIKKVLKNIADISKNGDFRDSVKKLYDSIFYHEACCNQYLPMEGIKSPGPKAVKPFYLLAADLKNSLFSKDICDLDRLDLALCRLYALGDNANRFIVLTNNLARLPIKKDNRSFGVSHVSEMVGNWFKDMSERR